MAEKITGYCVKCKKKNTEMKDPKLVSLKAKGGTSRKAVTGNCVHCDTKMFRFVAQDYELPR